MTKEEQLLKEIEFLQEDLKTRDGKLNYLLLMVESKLQAQAEMIVEMSEIITHKPPGQLTGEYAGRVAQLMKENTERFHKLPVKK